jgi:hypothetical protein
VVAMLDHVFEGFIFPNNEQKKVWCTHSLKGLQLPERVLSTPAFLYYLKPERRTKDAPQTVHHYSRLLLSEDLCHASRTKPSNIPGDRINVTRFSRTPFPRARYYYGIADSKVKKHYFLGFSGKMK